MDNIYTVCAVRQNMGNKKTIFSQKITFHMVTRNAMGLSVLICATLVSR